MLDVRSIRVVLLWMLDVRLTEYGLTHVPSDSMRMRNSHGHKDSSTQRASG